MRYAGSLLVVKDMECSKRFYHDVLGQNVVNDFGANVVMDGGFSLQTQDSWLELIQKKSHELVYGGNDTELYFEEDQLDDFCEKLHAFDVSYVHGRIEHPWGQRAIRFYDPDRHVIEVAESLRTVVQRFLRSGLSIEQTALRMDIPVALVLSHANENKES